MKEFERSITKVMSILGAFSALILSSCNDVFPTCDSEVSIVNPTRPRSELDLVIDRNWGASPSGVYNRLIAREVQRIEPYLGYKKPGRKGFVCRSNLDGKTRCSYQRVVEYEVSDRCLFKSKHQRFSYDISINLFYSSRYDSHPVLTVTENKLGKIYDWRID